MVQIRTRIFASKIYWPLRFLFEIFWKVSIKFKGKFEITRTLIFSQVSFSNKISFLNIHYSCRLYCWQFWYCHNLGTNLAALINLLFHSGISSLLRFWSGHIYSIDTIWRNSLCLLSYHDKMLEIQRIIQRFQCTT